MQDEPERGVLFPILGEPESGAEPRPVMLRVIRMENLERLILIEMEELVSSHRHLRCTAVGKEALYGFIERVLKMQQYRRLSKRQKGAMPVPAQDQRAEPRPGDAADPAPDGAAMDRAGRRRAGRSSRDATRPTTSPC